jgi:hypothetical protein
MASYISLIFYSYLDPIILKAWRVPHLGLSDLPALEEKDSAAVLAAEAFPVSSAAPVSMGPMLPVH